MRVPMKPLANLTFFVLASTSVAQSLQVSDENIELVRHLRSTPGLFSTVFSATPCAESHVHGQEWCYAVDGGQSRAIDGVGHRTYEITYHDTATVEQAITDLDSIGRFDVSILDVVVSTGPQRGQWTSVASFTNTTSEPQSVRVYSFTNVDLNDTCCGEYGDYSLPCSRADSLVFADLEDCGGFLAVSSVDADGFEVGAPITVVARVIAGVPLLNAGLPFGSPTDPRDVACAFAWDLAIEPGATASCVIVLESVRHDTAARVRRSGFATNGTFTPLLSCTAWPRVGHDVIVQIDGVGDSFGVLLFAVTGAPSQLAVLGLHVIAQPIVVAVPVAATSGRATYCIQAQCDPSIAGASLSTQAFVHDLASPADVPLSHSDVMTLTFGD